MLKYKIIFQSIMAAKVNIEDKTDKQSDDEDKSEEVKVFLRKAPPPPEIKKDESLKPKSYKLSGYLYKLSGSGRSYVRGLSGFGSSNKKRWFVYSEKTCKLYYYKSEDDPEPLGEIDISLATFFFDPDTMKDPKLDGQFKIK